MPQASQSMFVYQNSFWPNLHQFLRGEIYRRGANLKPGIDPYRYNQLPRPVLSAFERHWLPYLEGKTPLAQALHDLVRHAR